MDHVLIGQIRTQFTKAIAVLCENGNVHSCLNEARILLRELRKQYSHSDEKTAKYILTLVHDAIAYTPIQDLTHKEIRLLDVIMSDFAEGALNQESLNDVMRKIIDSSLSTFPVIDS